MILQALNRHYDRLYEQGRAPALGYSPERISYAIVLSARGVVVDVQPLVEASNGKTKPVRWIVPQPPKRASNIAPAFLWDKTEYALGITGDKKKTPERVARCHAAFKFLHQELLEGTDDENLQAFLAFLDQWVPMNYAQFTHAEDMRDTNVVFRVDGQPFLHQLPTAKTLWSARYGTEGNKGEPLQEMCLVTGETTVPERLHPPIKNFGDRRAHTSGVDIVSFNRDAFTSRGRRQGGNAPVSAEAAFGYTAALNALLSQDSGRKLRIGDATMVFWAEAADSPTAAEEAESLVASMLQQPKPDDEQEAEKVGDLLRKVAAGRSLKEIAPGVDEKARFWVLGLSPAARKRLAVRFWHTSDTGTLFEQLAAHWRDLQLEPPPSRHWPPDAWRLLLETAARRDRDNILPTLSAALLTSILTGARYPRLLLQAVISRLRTDSSISPARIAIVKACLRREQRLKNPDQEDLLMSLDRTSESAAYNLGRLFAVYAYAEKSNKNPKSTIRDKYAGAASATPQRVFPVLMRGYEHNRSSLLKTPKKKGAGVRADQAVAEILDRLPGARELPVTLTLEDQGRFFIGYHHQENALYSKTPFNPEE